MLADENFLITAIDTKFTRSQQGIYSGENDELLITIEVGEIPRMTVSLKGHLL